MGCTPKQQPNTRRVFAMGSKTTTPTPTASPAASPSKRAASASGANTNNRSPARRAAPATPPAPTTTTALALALFLGLLLAFAPLAAATEPNPVAAVEGEAETVEHAAVPGSEHHNLTSHVTADPSLFSSDALKAFDADIQTLAANGSINGARVLGAQGGRVVFDYTAGYEAAKHAGGEPWFRLFSMTKPVTAALALILAEEGVVGLDDEFALYVPELGNLTVYDGLTELLVEEEALVEGKKVTKQSVKQTFLSHPAPRNATIRELLTHTAGFAYGDNMNHPVDESYDRAMLQDFYRHTEESFLRELRNIPLLTEPGTEFHYSLGFDVLGVTLARAAGTPLDKLMKEKIFKPLGMKHTGFHLPAKKPELLAPMVEEEDFGTGVFNDVANLESDKGETDPSFKSGGGGLMATAPDYMRFAQMLLNGGELDGVRILSEASVAAMTSNQLPPTLLPYHLTSFPGYNGSAFGFGVMVIDNAEVAAAAPKGEVSWAGMASNSWWISPKHQTALLAMTQHIPYHKELQDTVKPFFYSAVHEQRRARSLRGAAARAT